MMIIIDIIGNMGTAYYDLSCHFCGESKQGKNMFREYQQANIRQCTRILNTRFQKTKTKETYKIQI